MDDEQASNREKKVAGRAKRRRYKQGTRSYLHAVTNSVARRLDRIKDRSKDGDQK
jgi:hypothetical protein